MAEAIARHWVRQGVVEGGEDLLVASAGVYAGEGMAMTSESAVALDRLGVDTAGNGGSTPLSAAMVDAAEVVLCMTSAHESAVRDMLGEAATVVQCLDPDGDLPDPIGQGQPVYDALAEHLMELIPRRLKDVLGQPQGKPA
jgi:protein-tyrosine phosphatase